ncbi:MAG: DUF2703 domain-containing protein, partial [Planctomycetes bacterium]|nr:DUF2703 domain-containing protein [Planctomycetota bacterium]
MEKTGFLTFMLAITAAITDYDTNKPVQQGSSEIKVLRIERMSIEGGCWAPCADCSKIGEAFKRITTDLAKEFGKQKIKVTLVETKLADEYSYLSNLILINGKAVELIIPGVKLSYTYCRLCSKSANKEIYYKTLEYRGTLFEGISLSLIRKAAFLTTGLNEQDSNDKVFANIPCTCPVSGDNSTQKFT